MIDARARAVLDELERHDARERERGTPRAERLRQVTPEVGRFLHTLVLATRPRSIVEIGTSGGYSTVWLATAARAVGASVVTLEIDPAKVRRATTSLREAGVDGVAAIVEGDAFAYLRERRGAHALRFPGAGEGGHAGVLGLVGPPLPPGGLLVADNLTSHADDLAEFRRRAESDPRLSAVVVPIGRGELVAAKIG